MTRTIIAAMLLLGTAVAVRADTDVYGNVTRTPRSDYELHADGRYCDQQLGMTPNHVPPTAAYRKCMLSRGWRFNHKERDNRWINHRGYHCQDILGGAGSMCSMF